MNENREKQLRRCDICGGEGRLGRAEFRRHIREVHGGRFYREYVEKRGQRVTVRNHALRNPGKDYSK